MSPVIRFVTIEFRLLTPRDVHRRIPVGVVLRHVTLVDAAENLYTELEFAGLLSPEAVQTRLIEEGLGNRTGVIHSLRSV